MSSLTKGESLGTKLVELFANMVVERRNMINDYLRGRAYIQSVSGGVLILSFCFGLSSWNPRCATRDRESVLLPALDSATEQV
jgi:hypothetical protein